MSEISIPAPGSFKDRSTGLMIFGILTILLGLLVGLMVPLMIAAASINEANGVAAGGVRALLPAMAIYAILAVVNIWLGIGSILKRRWARALLLMFSWGWLVMGVMMTAFIALAMPFLSGAGQENLSPGVQTAFWISASISCFIFLILLPLGWLLFYRSPHVKATCESFDPVPRWTDACPLPVLAIALWMAMSAPCILLVGLVGMTALPFFGLILTGWPGRVLCVFMAAIWGWLAWDLYLLRMRGWWLTVVFFFLYMVSAVITFSFHNLTDLYAAMHISTKETAIFENSSIMSIAMIASPIFFTLLLFGYLVYIRKFFIKAEALPPAL